MTREATIPCQRLGLRALATAILVATLPPAPVLAQPAVPGLNASYLGLYRCNSQPTSALIAFSTSAAGVRAVFTFFEPGGDPRRPIGAFELTGPLPAGASQLLLTPTRWVGRPPTGWVELPLEVTVRGGRPFEARLVRQDCAKFAITDASEEMARREQEESARREAYASGPADFFRAGSDDERCGALLKWMARLEAEYPSNVPTNMRHVTNLFGNLDFTPVFGRPYEELSNGARDQAFKALTACGARPEMRARFGYAQYTLSQPFNRRSDRTTDGRSWIVPAVDRLEALRAEWASQLAGLRRLPHDRAGLRSTVERRYAVGPMFSALWPSEIAALEAAADTVATTIAETLVAAQVDSVLGSVSGTNAIASLQRYLRQSLRGSQVREARSVVAEVWRLLPENRAPRILAMLTGDQLERGFARNSAVTTQADRIANRINELTATALEGERAAVARFGPGLPGLEQGAAWFSEFYNRFSTLMDEPATVRFLEEFAAQRDASVTGAAPELRRRLQAATTSDEAELVLYRHVIRQVDGLRPAGRELLASADSRIATLEAAEAASRREAASICSKVPATGDAGAEPSARDVCLAVRGRLEAMDAGLAVAGTACEGMDSSADPLFAIVCLYANGGTAGTFAYQFRLTTFEKQGCAPTATRGEFRCSYLVAMRSDNPATGRILNPILILQGPQVVTQRFVRTAQGWAIR